MAVGDSPTPALARDGRQRPALARRDWLVAGQELLRCGGIRAVKLASLTRALGVTSGSFYHHFADMPAYLDALAEHWGETQPTEELSRIAGGPPLARLQRLEELHRTNRMGILDRAMRVWAYDDAGAQTAVARADAHLLSFIEQAFADMGFERDSARARALLMFSTGAATVYPAWPVDAPARARMLSVLTAPD